jgi:hypothetical protein
MVFLSIALHMAVAVGFALAYFHQPNAPASLPVEIKQPALVLISSQIGTPELQSLAPSKPVISSVTPSLPQPEASVPSVIPHESLVTDAKSSSVATAEANPNANLPLPRAEAILSPNPPPPLNSHEGVVFLLDVSGSMYEPYAGSTRLMMAREELAGQIRSLKNGAPFAVTVYAQSAHNSGPLVAAGDATREAAVRFIMQDFDCGGGTNLPAGLSSAQELHPGHIVLASDGDLNANENDLLADAHRILGTPGHGPALSIMAIWPRSSTNAEQLLQGLADQQNGSCAVEPPPTKTALLTTGKPVVTAP